MKTVLDTAGIVLSIACAIHCSLTPIAIMMLPIMAPYLESHIVHEIVGPLVIGIALLALQRGYTFHGMKSPFVPAALGALFLLAAPLFHGEHHHGSDHHGTMDALLSCFGGMCFIVAHLWNVRLIHAMQSHWSETETF